MISRRGFLKTGLGVLLAGISSNASAQNAETPVSISIDPKKLSEISRHIYYHGPISNDGLYHHPQLIRKSDIINYLEEKQEKGTGSESIEISRASDKFIKVAADYCQSRGLDIIGEYEPFSNFMINYLRQYEKYKTQNDEQLREALYKDFGIGDITEDVKKYAKAIRSY